MYLSASVDVYNMYICILYIYIYIYISIYIHVYIVHHIREICVRRKVITQTGSPVRGACSLVKPG